MSMRQWSSSTPSRIARLRASTLRQPSISRKNSASTSLVPRPLAACAYGSNEPSHTASREKRSQISRQWSGFRRGVLRVVNVPAERAKERVNQILAGVGFLIVGRVIGRAIGAKLLDESGHEVERNVVINHRRSA